MENLDTIELIEQYLSGALPPTEQRAVEARIAADAAFRADVELHRQLHDEFADPKKLELRDLLADILQDAPPPPPAKSGWLKGLGIMLIILLAGWMGWKWLSPAREQAPNVQEQAKSAPLPTGPIATPETRTEPSVPIEKTPNRPIAMANPADFVPNRDFEDRLSGGIRAASGSADMQSPAKGANFTPENGLVKINFRGTAPADADTARFPLALKIYSNQASNPPLFRLLPAISNRSTATDKWTFSASQRLRLKPGLYYFTIERQEDDDLVFVGKFTVGKR